MSDASIAFLVGVFVSGVFTICITVWAEDVASDRAWPLCAAEGAQLRDSTAGFAICERPDGSLIALRVGGAK
ncbi:MAG TPA: hypothetical protein VFV33_04685 [Gemmatimonadaceae bacterium]|nr:hypothetical protein [Gemmatimonadaceae bacterium]